MEDLKELHTVTRFDLDGIKISSCVKIKADGIYLPLPICIPENKMGVFLVKIATHEQIVEIYEKFIKPHEEVTNG